MAIWRAFPERASLRSGLLPDTYSIQTWVWDAKTKLGFLSGGTREGGWRVTAEGASWLDGKPKVRDLMRALLLDPDDYQHLASTSLILACLEITPSSRAAVIIEAFRRFPEVYGLEPTLVWPDAALVDDALMKAEHQGLVVNSPRGFGLTPSGKKMKSDIESGIGTRREIGNANRRSIATQYVSRVEATSAYRAYLETGDGATGTADELYVLMRCPPNAGIGLAEASLAELVDNLARADRQDLVEFVARWTSRVAPDIKAYQGGRRQ